MLPRGLYTALVTPFQDDGSVSLPGLARLFAFQESSGASGIVLGGTNGEGASLSAIERRDMLKEAAGFRGGLKLILGIVTSSIHEAVWLSRQGAKLGADALLLSPPPFWRRAGQEGLALWLREVMDQAGCPCILYHNPPANGTGLPLEHLPALLGHPGCAGVKNSDVDEEGLAWWRSLVPQHQVLWAGDERMLGRALDAGWTGSISGAANLLPQWLSAIISEWPSESARTKLTLVTPALNAIRRLPQPESHKAALAALRLLDNPSPRLPLMAADREAVLAELRGPLESLGIKLG